MVLSEEQIDFYNDQGYLLVEDVITEDQLKKMLDLVEGFFENSKNVTENNNIFDLEEGHSSKRPRLKELNSHINIRLFFGI